jgi:hopanoid biosynthesis associated protein HpnK
MTRAAREARLIVHADDFGLSESVNRAVIVAHENGIVTSTSLMAGGDAFEHAVTLAKACPTLDVGVHLTLTEQRPVAAPETVRSLVGADGSFAPHAIQFTKRYLRGEIALADIRTELDAQIRRVLEHGLVPSHLDGHQHVHVLPGIARIVAELARRYDVRAVRYPAERLCAYMLKDFAGATRVLQQLALGGLSVLSPLRTLRRAERFVGFYFGGRLDERNLRTVLEHLPAHRTTELMCHPGFDDPASRYGHWNYAWAAETAALSSPRIKEMLKARGVRLIGYRDT